MLQVCGPCYRCVGHATGVCAILQVCVGYATGVCAILQMCVPCYRCVCHTTDVCAMLQVCVPYYRCVCHTTGVWACYRFATDASKMIDFKIWFVYWLIFTSFNPLDKLICLVRVQNFYQNIFSHASVDNIYFERYNQRYCTAWLYQLTYVVNISCKRAKLVLLLVFQPHHSCFSQQDYHF